MIEIIDFKLPGYIDRNVRIELNSKNLIITGGNGCGKTRFLTQIDNYLCGLLEKEFSSKEKLNEELSRKVNYFNSLDKSEINYGYLSSEVDILNKKIKFLVDNELTFLNLDYIYDLVNEKKIVYSFFKADRLSRGIAGNGSISSIASIKREVKDSTLNNDFGVNFERYLIGFYNYASHVIARENSSNKAEKIDLWFNKVEEDLRNLFEDESLKLKYNPIEQCFNIIQEGKEPFKFDELSSGYSSILSIYADLLMKVELKEIPANEITGFVLIDEIDAHLHVTIQRKIFSFFTKAFPKIQFIISTHSPFVVQSVNDAVIYDLSKMERLDDLSMYSYESILKGLLGVDSTSDYLNCLLEKMAYLLQEKPMNKLEIENLILKMEPHQDKMDSKSRAFLLLAKNKILDLEDGEV